MFSRLSIAAVAIASALCAMATDPPFTFCKDKSCGDCHVSVNSVGPGYPECIIYNTRDVFDGQGFPSGNNSLISTYIDVPQQNKEAPCYLIFKSPATTTQPGCGEVREYFGDATCGKIDLGEAFMVQFCCGYDDCAAAGIPNQPAKPRRSELLGSAKFGRGASLEGDDPPFKSGGGGAQSLRIAVNGTEIEPMYVGPPQMATQNASSVVSRGKNKDKGKGKCDGNWKPDTGYEDYTRPADGPQIVSDVVRGDLTITVTTTRTQEWSTTIEESIGFADIVSLGASFSQTFSESLMNSEAVAYHVLAGQSGYIGWTSYLRCSRGSGTCDDKKVSGEICTPYLDANSKKLAGRFSVVESGSTYGG
ncbi:hypothetical protein F5Y10DRAFT_261031 [Nemania abortiva]|nr:hypothetical protein F5Y10DRAFT_261031 [Nemania abortiva]